MGNVHGTALRVGIIGDLDPSRASHVATNAALRDAAGALSLPVELCWLPTPSLAESDVKDPLASYDALWCAPGSPYASAEGALRAIRTAREGDWPFIGT